VSSLGQSSLAHFGPAARGIALPEVRGSEIYAGFLLSPSAWMCTLFPSSVEHFEGISFVRSKSPSSFLRRRRCAFSFCFRYRYEGQLFQTRKSLDVLHFLGSFSFFFWYSAYDLFETIGFFFYGGGSAVPLDHGRFLFRFAVIFCFGGFRASGVFSCGCSGSSLTVGILDDCFLLCGVLVLSSSAGEATGPSDCRWPTAGLFLFFLAVWFSGGVTSSRNWGVCFRLTNRFFFPG